MNDYVLNEKTEPVEMVWAFDLGHPLRLECCPSLAGAGEDVRRTGEGRWGKAFLGGGDRGEVSNPVNQKTAVNTTFQFLHKASLLIPSEFAETKTAAGRRRMWRTRQAHKAREQRLTDDRRVRWPVRPSAWEPFRVLVAGAAPVGDAFAAQKGDIPLHTARHRAPGELAIRLAVALAVQDVRAQRGGIELRGDGRQTLIIDGRGHHLALRAVKPFAQPDVIHVIIFHARRSLQTATAADDPVASPARTVPRRCENQF